METKPDYYFKNISQSPFKEIFNVNFIWEVLKRKDDFLEEVSGGNAVVDPTVEIKEGCVIEKPCWIGENCVIGPSAYIRKNTVIGKNCKIRGEVKNSVICDNTNIPHHSYVGDSVFGSNVNFAAGAITTNFKFDGSNIEVKGKNLGRKFGAVIGDNVKVGSNVVTAPGTFIGPDTWIYPLSFVRGFVPENSIIKNKPNLEIVKKN